MKKILSFILVLAMVLGCVSMVTFASDDEWTPDENTVTGIKAISDLTNSNKALYAKFSVTESAVQQETIGDVTSEYLLLQFKIYNLNDVNVTLTPKICEGTGWKALTDVTYPGNDGDAAKQTILAHSYKIYTIKVKVVDGKYVVSSAGNTDITKANSLLLRWDDITAANQEIVVEALNEASARFCSSIGATSYIFSVTKVYGTEYYKTIPTAKSVEYKISAVASSHDLHLVDVPLFAADATFTGTKYVGYTFYNTSNCDYVMYMSIRKQDGTTKISDQRSVVIPAGKQASIVIPLTIVEGVYTYSNASYNLNELYLALDFNRYNTTETVGETFSVAPLNEDSSNCIFLTSKTPGNTSKKVKVSIPDCDTFDNGDASLGVTSNWTYFNGYKSITADVDPDDATNSVIKFAPSGLYNSGSFDFGYAMINNPNMNLYGGGPGEYTITFRVRFVDANYSGRLKPTLTSSNDREVTLGAIDGYQFVTANGSEWTTFTGKYLLTEAIHKKLVDGNFSTFKLRIDASEGGNAYAVNGKDANGNYASYYLDDMTIVKTPELTGIELVSKPNKTEYEFGAELDTTGLSINAIFDNGSKQVVTEGFAVTGYDASIEGAQTVTVTYEGFTTTFEVTVKKKAPEPVGIQVTAPDKTTYESGDAFDATGLKVDLVYDDDSTKPLAAEDYTVSTVDTLLPGTKSITVSYGTFTDTFDITVNVTNPVGLYIDILDASNDNAGAVVLNGADDTLFESDPTFTGTKKIAYKVYNPTDRKLEFTISVVEKGSWSNRSKRATNVPAKSWAICYLDIAIKDGIYSYAVNNDTTYEYDMGDLRLRFDAKFTNDTNDDYCIVVPCDDVNTYVLDVTYMNGSATQPYHVGVIPEECLALTRYEAKVDYNNGDGSNGKTGWSVFNSGSVANVDGAIKYTAGTSYYGSIFYDLTYFLVNNQYVNIYGGQGLGTYDLSFRVKAEEGKSHKFGITILDKAQKVVLRTGYSVIMTDEWQTVNVSIELTQADVNKLIANNITELGIRLDGGSGYKDAGLFSYYLDDLTFAKRDTSKFEGMKITTNVVIESQDAGTRVVSNPAKLTADMADADGVITRKYALYNTSNDIIYISMFHQAGPDHYKTLVEGASAHSVVLHPGERSTFTFTIVLTENGGVKYKDGNGVEQVGLLSDVNVRFEIAKHTTHTTVSKGATFYIQSLNENEGIFAAKTNDLYMVEGVEDFSFYNEIKGAAPVIGESLELNITTKAQYGEKIQLMVTRKNETDTPNVVYLDGVNNAGTYIFKYQVNAQCMGDEIMFALIIDGVTVKTYGPYSIKQYVINIFENPKYESDTTLKTLLSDMLVYGAEAQKYVNYKADKLVTDNLPASVILTPSNNGAPTTAIDNSNATNTAILSAGLNISHVNKIFFRLNTSVNMKTAKITITANGENISYTVKGRLIYTDAILATGFDTAYTITVVESDGTTSVINYSVNTYIAAMYDGYGVSDICKALNNYGQSAQAYANNAQ